MEEKKSHYYSLGEFIAEYLISRHIPSLSCNQCTRNVIQVTWGEAEEQRRLEEAWFSKRTEEKYKLRNTEGLKDWEMDNEAHRLSENEWNENMKYRYILKEKYLPHFIKCRIPHVDFSNEEINKQIKEGLKAALWDWDFCEWSLADEDIVFENEELKYGDNDEYSSVETYVTLKLDLERPSSYTGEDWIEIKTPQKK